MPGRTRGRSGRGWDATPRQAGSDLTTDTTATDPTATDSTAAAPRARRSSSGRSGSARLSTGRSVNGWPVAAPGDGDQPPADTAERAREICLRQLSVRPRTRAELAAALSSRGISDEVAAEVLDRYGEVGMIDDQAFARAWVTSRHHSRGLAKKALAGELRRKGVEPDAVGAALDELGEDAELETARALVGRKLRGDAGADSAATARRLVGMLARKGYPAGLAFRVVREVMAERAAEQVDTFSDEAADDLEHSILAALDDGADAADPSEAGI